MVFNLVWWASKCKTKDINLIIYCLWSNILAMCLCFYNQVKWEVIIFNCIIVVIMVLRFISCLILHCRNPWDRNSFQKKQFDMHVSLCWQSYTEWGICRSCDFIFLFYSFSIWCSKWNIIQSRRNVSLQVLVVGGILITGSHQLLQWN